MRRSLKWLVAVTIVFVLMGCLGIALPIDFAGALVLGWAWYLSRTLPHVQVASAGVATAAVCVVLFFIGSHIFLSWLYRELQSSAGGKAALDSRWRWRWTGGLTALFVLMFVAGMSVVGVTHQLGWLVSSKEPWVVSGSGAQGAAARAMSTNNLKQIGMALHAYHQDYDSFPPGGTFDRQGRPLASWQAMILPYLEQSELHKRIDFSIPWNDPRNAPIFQTVIQPYLRPFVTPEKNAAGYALSHYAANVYMLGGACPRSLSAVSDGTASTLMAGEVMTELKPWGDPTNWRDPALGLNQNPGGFASPSPGGVNFLMVDGSVRFINNSVHPEVLKALSTPAGHEKIGSDQY
jgi:prepilin-type processing-associated H-X9-DG protein